MAALVKVRECGLGLQQPRLNAGPVCEDNAAEGSICANAALCKQPQTLPFVMLLTVLLSWQHCIDTNDVHVCSLLRRDWGFERGNAIKCCSTLD